MSRTSKSVDTFRNSTLLSPFLKVSPACQAGESSSCIGAAGSIAFRFPDLPQRPSSGHFFSMYIAHFFSMYIAHFFSMYIAHFFSMYIADL